MPSHIEEIDAYLQEKGMDRVEFHGIDQSWGFREGEPIIGVIGRRESAFQAAMSLYWASADFITKPWCLLLVDSGLHDQQKAMLDNLSRQHNIRMVSEDRLFTVIESQLDWLVKVLDVYIEYNENPINSLGESMKKWRTDKPAHEHSFRVDTETGKLDVYMENGELSPGRKTIPLTVTSDDARIEGVLPRLVSTENGLLFDTEHRNLPVVFKLQVAEDSELVMRFEADKSNIIEATVFWGLFNSFTVKNKLAFIAPNTGDTLFSCWRKPDD